jgi:hypothetical protein
MLEVLQTVKRLTKEIGAPFAIVNDVACMQTFWISEVLGEPSSHQINQGRNSKDMKALTAPSLLGIVLLNAEYDGENVPAPPHFGSNETLEVDREKSMRL